jgi:hypothetical protein
MAKLKNFLLKSSIDSFKYRIDLDKVKILDSNLLDCLITQTVNSATGEIISSKELKLNSLKPEFDYYHVHFAINDLFGEKFLVILINSKLLEKDYLNGISMNNIELIYNRIMSAKIIELSFEDFLQFGLVSDIDVKKDFELDIESFKTVINTLYQNTKPTKQSKYGVNKFTKEQNLGIEWNRRENASSKHPFLKLYHKEIESKHGNNKEYFYNHIDLNQTKNVVRCEATIKGTKELTMYGIEGNRLIDLMKVPESKLSSVIEYAIDLNIEPRLRRSKPKEGMTATETVIYAFIVNMIQNQNQTFETILNHILSYFNQLDSSNNATNKMRAKKLLNSIYEEHINGKISEVKAKKLDSFFSNFGWIEKHAI